MEDKDNPAIILNPVIGFKKPPPGFKPGHPRYGGRHKEPLTTLLRDYLEENDGERKQELVRTLYDMAVSNGDRSQFGAINTILERIDGKVADKLSIQGIIAHVGNEYAELGLRANRIDIEERKLLLEGNSATE